MTSPLTAAVEIDGETVDAGTAYFNLRGRSLSTAFTYDAEYLARRDAYALDPGLPMFRGQHVVAGLPGAFADCAPDRWGRNLIEKRIRVEATQAGRTPPAVTDIDYLARVSDITRQGALRFRSTEGIYIAPDADVPKLIDLPSLLRASDAVSRDPDDMTAIKALLGAGTGTLGGARPKASIRDGGRLYVAKFPKASDEWDVMAWEKTALDLADRAGIEVPHRRLETVDGRGVLLLERFDRTDGRRIGYMSAMTMMQKRDGDTSDYADIAETWAEFGSDTRRDLEHLWRRAALSVLIHNTDDHLRNHGLLRDGGGWKLAPAFDINPNPDIGEGRATTIGGAQHVPEEIAALIDFAPVFRLTETRTRSILSEVLDATARWREIARSNGIKDGEIERFSAAFETLRPEAERFAIPPTSSRGPSKQYAPSRDSLQRRAKTTKASNRGSFAPNVKAESSVPLLPRSDPDSEGM